jgi:hypothetical protein
MSQFKAASHLCAMPGRLLAVLVGVLCAAAATQLQAGAGQRPGAIEELAIATKDSIRAAYARRPISFTANEGQADPRVEFLARGDGYTFFLTSSGAVMRFGSDAVLRVDFAGGNPRARSEGRGRLPGMENYLLGDDPSRWRVGVPTYAKVAYTEVFSGIDLVYYGNQGQLEYDFVVRPGADPNAIKLGFRGADGLAVSRRGDLEVQLGSGELVLRKPFVYQDVDGVRREVQGGYVLMGDRFVGFRVGPYDAGIPLVIDPVLFYSTYLGGTGDDSANGIAVDPAGNAYVTGLATSTDFPTTVGAFQPVFAGVLDVFVTKLNPTGSGLVYSTYLGGGSNDVGNGITLDGLGNAYVTGFTTSTDFPTTAGAFQPSFGGVIDAFVTKLDPTGSGLVYSSYLGGSGDDNGSGVRVDLAGSAYAVGTSGSTDFPTTAGAFQSSPGGNGDAFVTKLNPTGSALVYSTYLGGSSSDSGLGVALDAAGQAHVTGDTTSPDFPTTAGTFQPAFGGDRDAYAAKLNVAGSGVIYSTYLGGGGFDEGFGIAVEASGNASVVGDTSSSDFPTTAGAFQPALNGPDDGFVTRLDTTGSGLVYSTFLGGSGSDATQGIVIDGSGNAYVVGVTTSTDFPTMDAFQPSFGGGTFDAFVAKINPTGSGLVYSSYLGGSGDDNGFGIALDSLPNPSAHATGFTASTDFPTTAGAFQTMFGGIDDAFVAKITETVLPPPPVVGKVTGGGSIDVPGGGIGTFGFIVQRKTTAGPISGQLQYINHASGAVVHSVEFTMLVIAGNTAMLGGTCTSNGSPCTFMVNVMDNGEPGAGDTFTISVSGGPTEGGLLASGNIQIHPAS